VGAFTQDIVAHRQLACASLSFPYISVCCSTSASVFDHAAALSTLLGGDAGAAHTQDTIAYSLHAIGGAIHSATTIKHQHHDGLLDCAAGLA
jgi:hypothetical protein